MNELAKSIRFGTVDFFGIIIPGFLVISMYFIGCFTPILFFLVDVTHTEDIDWNAIYSNYWLLILLALIIFSYVLGYIIRLSSPDELDKESAKRVINSEIRKGVDIEKDGWPYDLGNPMEKYPYSKFREYLIKRGHEHLTRELVTWSADEFPPPGATWPDEALDGKAISMTKRSKTTINKMKMCIRMHCPELSGLIESKEGHIRLMAGTWAAFKLSIAPVGLTLLLMVLITLHHFLEWRFLFTATHDAYPLFVFANIILLAVMLWAKNRIEKLFHYRRVSELFHIVQAAYFAQQVNQNDTRLTSHA